MDCWFDSGSMPFAQHHYPFENKDLIDKNEQYPADYICEAIDQTRGWFYTLLAVSTMLGKGTPYKNVICLGHILDKNGQKMSKHIGNIIDPWLMIEKYGADVVRWHLYTVNQPGETKKFSEDGLRESGKMFITLLNVVSFYKMFAIENTKETKEGNPKNILDKWIISKLNLLTRNITENLDQYNIITAGRRLEEFINDLSVWYLRRSRDRFKEGDKDAIQILGYVLINISKLIAPFIPFTAEYIYRELSGKLESVHLENWPEVNKKLIDEKLEEQMQEVRNICSLALQIRAEKGIKVRQPLASLKIRNPKSEIRNNDELSNLIKDEINVKEIVFGAKIETDVELDTNLTEELKEEGLVRDFIRSIQSKRKEMGLTPKDKIRILYSDDKEIIEKYAGQIKKQVIAEEIVFNEKAGLAIDKL
jgi:isoleucyl-tRNA synthetase